VPLGSNRHRGQTVGMTAARDRELEAIDAFLAGKKRLQGAPPAWTASLRPKELQAIWLVEDELGIVRGRLCFRCWKNKRTTPSFSLIWRSNPVWRIDIEEPTRREFNPHWAHQIGCPPFVIGSHGHEWPDNREHLRSMPPEWDLPCRRTIPINIRKLDSCLAWFAGRVNLELGPSQRGFDVPPQTELF
jgi:hypothetical protein